MEESIRCEECYGGFPQDYITYDFGFAMCRPCTENYGKKELQ